VQLRNDLSPSDSSIERIPCAQPHQWLYLFGSEGGIVYSEIHNRFAGLDAAGVVAYLSFDTDLHAAQASIHAPDNVIESIRALAMGIFPPTEPQHEWPAFTPNLSGETIEIGSVPASVQFPAGPLEKLCRDPFRGCQPTTLPPQCHLSARHTKHGWSIFVNDQPWMPIEKEEQLGLGFLHAARAMLYQLANYNIAFHAAMVAQQDRGILLCAPRESGKSTLTAYLTATGFDFLADEPALLQLDTGSVQPLPLPISLKSGSWPHIAPICPALTDSQLHKRSDGMPIRLLLPPEQHISRNAQKLTHILFPSYTPSPVAQPERLSPLRTLILLDTGGMLLAPGSTRKTFEAFLHMLQNVPAFALPFSSLSEAAQILHTLR